MNPLLTHTLAGLEFGDVQKFNNLAVYPLFSKTKSGPRYITLKEALEANAILIGEVSAGDPCRSSGPSTREKRRHVEIQAPGRIQGRRHEMKN